MVPRAVQRYVFLRLVGSQDVGPHHEDEDGQINPKRFIDPWEATDPPLEGFYNKRRQLLRESTALSQELAELYFCPHCGDGPHSHPDDKPYIDYLEDERASVDQAAAKFGREIALLNKFIDVDLMGDAYRALESELSTDKHWFAFIEAARNAQLNFSEYRRIYKRATKLLSEVSTVALTNRTLSGTTTAARPVVFNIVRMCCSKFSCWFDVVAQKSCRL